MLYAVYAAAAYDIDAAAVTLRFRFLRASYATPLAERRCLTLITADIDAGHYHAFCRCLHITLYYLHLPYYIGYDMFTSFLHH